MPAKHTTSSRKNDHLDICLNANVQYKNSDFWDLYVYEHNALTDIDYNSISLKTNFCGKVFDYPFLISSMTGGTKQAESINEKLAEVASELNIPIGVGSQRQALENKANLNSFQSIRKNNPDIFVFSNIGAGQVSSSKTFIDDAKKIVDMIEANALYIHLNPLQEIIQTNGDTNFSGLLNNIEDICKNIDVPIFIKEVGAGISKKVARKLLEVGVDGVDVAGSGGTSWAAVELVRNKESNDFFRNWGLPTTYCIKRVSELKNKYKFSLISSGGIDSGSKIAKSLSLGADFTASARPIFIELSKNGTDGVIKLIKTWFEDVKKIQFLTGTTNIDELKKVKLLNKSELF